MNDILRLKKLFENNPIGLAGYAKLLGMSNKTLYNKLIGASDFSYLEYLKLKTMFPEYNVDYLLTEEPDGEKESAAFALEQRRREIGQAEGTHEQEFLIREYERRLTRLMYGASPGDVIL